MVRRTGPPGHGTRRDPALPRAGGPPRPPPRPPPVPQAPSRPAGLEALPEGAARSLAQRFLAADLADNVTRRRTAVRGAASVWRAHRWDTGSPAVQVAQWTAQKARLDAHIQAFPKDTKAKRTSQLLGARRHKMLRYLRSRDYELYFRVVTNLGLRDGQPRPYPQRHRFAIQQVVDLEEGLEALSLMDQARGEGRFRGARSEAAAARLAGAAAAAGGAGAAP